MSAVYVWNTVDGNVVQDPPAADLGQPELAAEPRLHAAGTLRGNRCAGEIRVVRNPGLAARLAAVAAFTLAGCGGSNPSATTTTMPTSTIATPTSKPYIGPNGLPMETGAFVAPSTTTRLGAIINGIQCEPFAQLAYTAYAHLQVYVKGRSRALPGGIGIVDENPRKTPQGLFYGALTCMYWVHTRTADGLVEVQSPVSRTFTLGDLFAVWHQPLNRTRVARSRGRVTTFVNGRRWHGNPALVVLREHEAIQLTVGKPIPTPKPVHWSGTNF